VRSAIRSGCVRLGSGLDRVHGLDLADDVLADSGSSTMIPIDRLERLDPDEPRVRVWIS
jgi:hypothetical protein